MSRTRVIEILCLVVAALVLVCTKVPAANPWPVLALLAAFAAAIMVIGGKHFLADRTRIKLQIQSLTMVLFVTGVLWLSGKSSSPLLNLYLLPITLSALTLGRAFTLGQVGVIAVCHLALAAATPGLDVASWVYVGRATGELAPFLLVAYLTTGLSADITAARERIQNLAQLDSLTGLYNARMFDDVWRQAHALCEKRGGSYALLTVDMDRLQDINEQFGHDGGNSAIMLVAQCLQRSIRGTDTAARLGGDEFGVLLPDASSEVAEAVVKRVRHNVYKTTLDLRSRMIRCSVSIGVATYPKDGTDRRELTGAAERNMYRDKALRRAPAAGS